MMDEGAEMPWWFCTARMSSIVPSVDTRLNPWRLATNGPIEPTNQRWESGPAVIDAGIRSPPIENSATWPAGETRAIAEYFETQTFPSGPAASPEGRKPIPRDGLSPRGAMATEEPDASTAQTCTCPSSPEPTTQIFPSGPRAIARPSAAVSGIVNSRTSPPVVTRPTRFVPVSGNQRWPSGPTAMSPGVIDSAEATDDASCRSTAAGDAPEGPTSPRASREAAIRHEA